MSSQEPNSIPYVTVIIPNLNGRDMLESCLESVKLLDYPADRIECIVVDNGSVDGSEYFLGKRFPDVKALSLKENVGFAKAINLAADIADGDILFLLNNDAHPDPDCLSQLVAPIVNQETICTSAQIICQQRKRIMFDGGGMNFHGIAFQRGEGDPYHEASRSNQSCLLPCGAAMAVCKKTFLAVGGLDEDFFAYFEDVDFGWRLWLMGYNVIYVPNAITTHRQSQTSRFIDVSKLRVLHIRNPLMMIYKNYEERSLTAILPVALMLTTHRTLMLSELDTASFRIDGEPQLAEAEIKTSSLDQRHTHTMPIPKVAVSDFVALNDWISQFGSLDNKRADIQAKRVRRDSEILGLFQEPFRYSEPNAQYRSLQDQLCHRFGIDRLFNQPCEDLPS
jgi:hypothetical protein